MQTRRCRGTSENPPPSRSPRTLAEAGNCDLWLPGAMPDSNRPSPPCSCREEKADEMMWREGRKNREDTAG